MREPTINIDAVLTEEPLFVSIRMQHLVMGVAERDAVTMRRLHPHAPFAGSQQMMSDNIRAVTDQAGECSDVVPPIGIERLFVHNSNGLASLVFCSLGFRTAPERKFFPDLDTFCQMATSSFKGAPR
jgi:hypothetical protein